MRICKLKPRGAFHLGEKEAILEHTSDYIHSDTLFSAICNAYRLLYGKGKLEDMLELFKDRKPPFSISSAFPYTGESLLFPVPRNINFSVHPEDKKFKKVEFFSKTIFDGIAMGESIEEHIKGDNLVQSKHVLLTDAERDKLKGDEIWSSKEVPRVVIDRKTSASNIYHFGEVSFADNCGLYFLMDLRIQEYKEKVEAAIRLLGDEGIGGDRTYGKGLFKAEFNDEEIEMNVKSGNHFVTLSLYYPMEGEISLKEGYYELINIGGWIYSLDAKNLRRRTVRMFAEGSVFKSANTDLYGRLMDVTPEDFTEHSVYRYGYAFAVPMEVHEWSMS
jgi:CRISPR-associated protein Csm4